MKLWIARDYDNTLWIFEKCPIKRGNLFCPTPNINGSLTYYRSMPTDIFPEVTFENSPQEVEISLFHPVQLTRDYFAKHNWEIVIHDPDENGFILWEAKWKRSIEKGSLYYSDLTVTNMMHEDRFCVSGKTGEGNVEYLMAYTEEDLKNILKALVIYDYYKKES